MNPIRERVEYLVGLGWHPSTVRVDAYGHLTITCHDYTRGVLAGDDGLSPGASAIEMDAVPRDETTISCNAADIEAWMMEVAHEGGAPDIARFGDGETAEWMTRPVAWLPDALRAIIARRKPGRPPDGSKTRRDEPPVLLRLNPEERALASRVAAKLGTNLSDAYRRAMERMARELNL